MNQSAPEDRQPEDAVPPTGEGHTFNLTPDGEDPTPDPGPDAADLPDLSPQAVAELQQQLAQAESERDEHHAKLLRTAADYQNYIRRSQLNVEAEKQATLMKVAKALVGVLDNFDRAMELDPATSSAEDVQRGAATIQASLMQALESFGLKKITVEPGDEFDPNLHEALMRQPSDTIESNHIALQLLPGYLLKDQPVRPAQVSVAE